MASRRSSSGFDIEKGDGDGDSGGGVPPTVPPTGADPAAVPRGLHAIEAGTELAGRYRLEEELATGRASTVWAGRDEALDRRVAIKLLHLPDALDAGRVENFQREGSAIAQLAHRNIVRVYDVGDEEGLPFLVMEEVRGGSLKDALENGRLDAETTAALCFQAADALAATHAAGFAHRDVKPSNILLNRRGVVKLTDFGIVRDLQRPTTIRPEETLIGTARYLAPEQVEGERATPASDVYTLGLVLWEAWTGEAAFDRGTTAATALARLEERLRRPSGVRPGLPDALDEAIATAVARDPADRYPTGEPMREAVRGLVGPRPEKATVSLITSPGQPQQP